MKVETHVTGNDWLKPDHAHDQTTWGDELRAKNARLRSALAFYADPAHYADPPYGGLKDIEADGGQIAREALDLHPPKGGAG